MLPPKKTDPKKLQKLFDPTQEDFLPVRKVVAVTNPDGSKSYQYFYDKLPTEEGYDESLHSSIFTAQEHQAKQIKNSPEFSKRAVGYLNKTGGKLNRDVEKMVPTVPTIPTTLTQSTEEILPQLAYGTNSQGIMKSKMNPRKKYAQGTGAKGMDPANYIISPAEAMNDYNIMLAKAEAEANANPWLPIVAIAGQAMQTGIGIAGGAAVKKAGGTPTTTQAPTIDTEAINTFDFTSDDATLRVGQMAANGMNNVQEDVEVEGGEMFETPQGEVGEFQGPSHEQGGIPLEVGEDVEQGTKVYSDRLKLGGKTLAERKEAREKQIVNLEKTASNNLVDEATKNTVKRKIQAIEKEEAMDLQFQEQVNNMQAMADTMVMAFGTGVQGIQTYENGTGSAGINPITGLPEDANMATALAWAASQKMNTTLKDTDKAIADNALQNIEVDNTIAASDATNKVALDAMNPSATTSSTINPSTGVPYNFNILDAIKNLPKTDATTSTAITESVLPTSVESAEEVSTGQARQFGKPAVHYTPEEPNSSNKLSKILGGIEDNMPGVGDMTKLIGNYLGMTAGIKTAAEQRSTDVTHRNVFANAGEESQRLLDNAKQGIETAKGQAIVKASSVNRGGKKGARGSARGVNQMRAMDWLYDTALQEQVAQISANAAQQLSGIDTQKSSVAMSADQLKGQGEYQAAMANEAAKDAYYTALGLGRKDFATGMQQTGKDLNAMKQDKVVNNLLKEYGQWVKADKKGNLSNKRETAKDANSEEEVEVTLEGKKIKVKKSVLEMLQKSTSTK
jgi:hypothetical protein